MRATRGFRDGELQPGVWHRQGLQFGGREFRQPASGFPAGPRDSGRSIIKRLVENRGPFPQLLDPVVGPIELGQPLGCPPRPFEHLCNIVAVFAGQGSELAATIGDGLLSERVRDEVRSMAGDILGEVRQQVIHLGETPCQVRGARVAFGERLESLARGPNQPERAGGVEVLLRSTQSHPRGHRQGLEIVRISQAHRLRGQGLVLPLPGVHGLDLLQPEPQHVDLPGPAHRLRLKFREFLGDPAMLREVAAVFLQRRRCCEGVEQFPLPFGGGEPGLFGLAVDRGQVDQQTGHGGYWDLHPTDRGAGTSLGGNLPKSDELHLVVEVTTEGLDRLGRVLTDLPTPLHERLVLPVPDQ